MSARWKSSFMGRRIIEFFGLAFIFLAVFHAVSFLSYNPNDPSYNFKTDVPVQNIAGPAGAYVAGPVLEFTGLAGILLIIAPLIWGVKMVMKDESLKLWLRITMLALCLPALASLFALLDFVFTVPEKWPAGSFGGYVGRFIYKDLSPHITTTGFGIGAATLSFLTMFFALGVPLGKWGKTLGYIYKAFYMLVALPINLKEKLSSLGESETSYSPKKSWSKKPAKQKKLVEITRRKSASSLSNSRRAVQTTMDLKLPDDFDLPPVSLLKTTREKVETLSESALSQNATLLEKVLDDFGVFGKITRVRPGPVVTLYELEPAPGTKSSRVIGLADDIARSMSAVSARIATVPGKNVIGIELPNDSRQTVYLKELLESDEYGGGAPDLPLALGKDIGGDTIVVDLAKMPHLLVAGTTGSGKSVAINTMILSLLYRYSPEECRFIMIDPKMLELSSYEGIPHLLSPVVTEPGKAVVALKWTVKEMENRYRLMSTMGVRNVANYNKKIMEAKRSGEELFRSVQTGFDPDTGKPIMEKVPLEMKPLPFIVVVVDEMADLMLTSGKDIESSIQRLAQMARAAGIHIIMATQRPSVDVITGVIKANFPTRISFQVTSRIDSRTILGEQGAEQLLGNGDMLYMTGGSRITRIHGALVLDKEVEKVVSFLRKQGTPMYIEDVTREEEEGEFFDEESPADDLYDRAVQIVCRDQKASTSYIQRSLKIGYNRAATIIERMERDGVVSEANHVGKREVLVTQ